jgi:hypothetical protein
MPNVETNKDPKVGADDFLAAGGDLDELILTATLAGELETNATAMETRIAQLVELSDLEYEQVRNSAADGIGVRVGALDKLVKARRQTAAQKAKEAKREPPPPPWAYPVDGAALLAEIVDVVRRFVVIDET